MIELKFNLRIRQEFAVEGKEKCLYIDVAVRGGDTVIATSTDTGNLYAWKANADGRT
jgi:hypothetical protein